MLATLGAQLRTHGAQLGTQGALSGTQGALSGTQGALSGTQGSPIWNSECCIGHSGSSNGDLGRIKVDSERPNGN